MAPAPSPLPTDIAKCTSGRVQPRGIRSNSLSQRKPSTPPAKKTSSGTRLGCSLFSSDDAGGVKSECRMTNEVRISETRIGRIEPLHFIRHLDFVILSSFDIRHS